MRHSCIALLLTVVSMSAMYAQDDTKTHPHFKSIHGIEGIPIDQVKAASNAALADSIHNHRLVGSPGEYSVFAESRIPNDCNDCPRIQLNLFREGHKFSLRRPKKCVYQVIVDSSDSKNGNVEWIAGPIIYTIDHHKK